MNACVYIQSLISIHTIPEKQSKLRDNLSCGPLDFFHSFTCLKRPSAMKKHFCFSVGGFVYVHAVKSENAITLLEATVIST